MTGTIIFTYMYSYTKYMCMHVYVVHVYSTLAKPVAEEEKKGNANSLHLTRMVLTWTCNAVKNITVDHRTKSNHNGHMTDHMTLESDMADHVQYMSDIAIEV